MARNDTSNIFKNYPDALTLGEFAEMLGISQKLASKLIRTGEIDAVKVGREYASQRSTRFAFCWANSPRKNMS